MRQMEVPESGRETQLGKWGYPKNADWFVSWKIHVQMTDDWGYPHGQALAGTTSKPETCGNV